MVAGIGGVLGLISLTVPAPAGKPLIPTWLWVSLLVGGILVAQFLAFHDVRKERDAIKADMQSRFDSIRYRFQFVGLQGGPRKMVGEQDRGIQTGYSIWFVFLNGGVEVLDYKVESLTLVIGGHTVDSGVKPDQAPTVVLPGREARYLYPFIPAPFKKGEELAVGSGAYTVTYGHPSGGARFRAAHKFRVYWDVSAQGEAIPTWLTIEEVTHEPVR